MSKHYKISENSIELLFSGADKKKINLKQHIRKYWCYGEDGKRYISGDKIGFLIYRVIKALNDETLGFLERPSLSGAVQLSLRCIIGQRTLRRAFSLNLRYWSYIHRDFECKVMELDSVVKIQCSLKSTSLKEHEKLMFHLLFTTFCCKWMSWATNTLVAPIELFSKSTSPTCAQNIKTLFPCEINYNQKENYFLIDKNLFELPITCIPSDLNTFLRNVPHLIIETRSSISMADQIKRLISKDESYVNLSIERASELLHKSPSTISRRLRKEGLSFYALKEGIRKSLSCHYLCESEIPIKQIAILVGFSETSAFTRAFKSWFGQTPMEYRKKSYNS